MDIPYARARGYRPIQLDVIVRAVCCELRIDIDKFKGRTRVRWVVNARAAVAWLSRSMTISSYPEIAAAMGRRSHSAVIDAARRMERLRESGAVMDEDRYWLTDKGEDAAALLKRLRGCVLSATGKLGDGKEQAKP